MSARRGGAVLDVAQLALAPELASDFVGLAAVHQEFAGEAPVPVVFEPCMQSVLVTDVAQTAHVIIGHLVGHHTAHIPQEAVRRFLTADHHALVNGQIRRRVVAVAGFELFDHAVGEVLSAGLVAVLNDYAERLAVLGRNAAQNFAHMGIEVGGGMLAAHLVDGEAGEFVVPVGVIPMRRMTHSPSGASHVSVPSSAMYCEISCTLAGSTTVAGSSTTGCAGH